uniref:Uncharacterized protein n=1 Tax=Biomphalaria glabrata TaxID=6526 RepID=A0A2C9L432_BIOGL
MDTTPILTLCEVEIYGECPFGTWGLACDKACPAECSDWCHQGDGSCNTVCGGQSDPPLCTKNCVSTKWGLNCASSCSDHCVDQLCHRLTGECSQGCHGYEDPPLCTQGD